MSEDSQPAPQAGSGTQFTTCGLDPGWGGGYLVGLARPSGHFSAGTLGFAVTSSCFKTAWRLGLRKTRSQAVPSTPCPRNQRPPGRGPSPPMGEEGSSQRHCGQSALAALSGFFLSSCCHSPCHVGASSVGGSKPKGPRLPTLADPTS